ncbi:hypothetical protein EDD85DRAFT_949470 [Armillaria nabsnona]|nr:hypothetical protein EDD85DRAFT_949470 [Armillaria nabsnona]
MDDLASISQINDPWGFHHEVHMLKRIEADCYKHIKAKVQADIEQTQLHAQLQSKVPKPKQK